MSRAADRLADAGGARAWLVPALGVLLLGAAVAHFLGHAGPRADVAAATLLPAVALLGYGGWFWARRPRGARGDAVFAWAIGGAGLVLALDLWAILVDAYGATAAVDHIFIQHTTVGALGGAIAGTYSQRDRWRARSHVRLRRALDAAMDGIAVVDDDGTVSYANDAFADARGADGPGALVGEQWQAAYPDETRTRFAAVLAEFEAGDRDRWHGTVTARRIDGHTYPQDISVTALDDGGYVWVCRDVTGRAERDQRLRVLNRVLRHNVRNSLNVVLGRARRLTDRLGDDEDVESIEEAAEELLSVSEKARQLERSLDSEDAPTDPLADVVAQEAEHASEQYPDVAFDVTVDCETAVDRRLRLAVRELLESTAEHADGDAASVSIVARAEPPTVRVAADGSGIPEHERRALEGVEETSLEHGSGVGLWLVYWVVSHAGGDLDVRDDGTVVLRADAGKN
ncbi:PAS domain-containing protein [Halobacterium litoreum]|uniref:histidine kinase n=1 Tax=Halobacterium litoreum TaxID=2039234 RepID=A0ABD5NCP4_9EURY|nr:PAS domain-containing protein [Halobacterium litoreum]UHH14435.1 PAS domain-containing protein [Halobacterium litoreum]